MKNHTPCRGLKVSRRHHKLLNKDFQEEKNSMANIISLRSSEPDEKVESAAKKALLEKDVHSK